MPQDIVADILDQLEAQGMVMTEADDQESRYQLPEAQRMAAQAQLADSGETDATYDRLVVFSSRLAEQALQQAFGPQRAIWMQRLEREHANLRAALAWLVARGDAERGLRLADLLQELWFEEQHTSEGRAWFATLLSLPQAAARTTQRAQALDLAGAYALNQGDYVAARVLKEEGVAILRELGDIERLGYSLLHLGHLAGYAQAVRGRPGAVPGGPGPPSELVQRRGHSPRAGQPGQRRDLDRRLRGRAAPGRR